MKFLLVLLGLVSLAFSETCLSRPATLSIGQNCAASGGAGCKFGGYCDVNGQCATQVAAAGACDTTFSNQCAVGLRCVANDITTTVGTCLAYKNPGDSCTLNNECGTGSCLFGYCIGGLYGDSCFNSSMCLGGANCTNSNCDYVPDGGFCNYLYKCAPNSYCNSLSSTCQPKVPVGGVCAGATCVDGAFCIGKYPTDPSTSQVCVMNQTRAAGEYCYQYGDLCINSRTCNNQYCAKEAPVDCTSYCRSGQVCQCNGDYKIAGYGKCGDNPCAAKWTAIQQCTWTNCLVSSPSSSSLVTGLGYSGSCISKNCKQAALDYLACSPASAMSVSFSLIFFSLFFSFFVKGF